MSDILENEGSECGSATNFIHDIIDEDMREGVCDTVHTRFPPEPNGYLHIGSAKAIWINSSTAKKYGGLFNLRYDDTNPMKESDEYVRSIYEDLCWLGAEPNGGVYYGSDYFEQCYEYAVKLIRDGNAYVCDLSREDLERYRGDADDYSDKGIVSPYRDRPTEESLDLFRRMKEGEFPDGARTLRAKIDPNSDNSYLRDPVIYRIRHVHHHRQGDAWCIYPMYDFAHPIQDAIEGITYSLCSTEFRNHRPLYDWVVEKCGFEHRPKQREFGRMNVTYTVMSKRFLRFLVEHGVVDGWDDPRMPTLSGLRRRGYTPGAIFDFVSRSGVSNTDTTAAAELLDYYLREELGDTAPRRVCVTEPIKVVVDNYPEDKTEYFPLPNHPAHPELGTREVAFTRELYIEASDFAEVPPPKFHRLRPDGEVRLMGAYIVRLTDIVKNDDGSIRELHVTADLETGSGMPSDGRKVKGTVHWVSAAHCEDIDIVLYDRLFTIPDVASYTTSDHNVEEILEFVNPDSARRLTHAKAEPSIAELRPGEAVQFVRMGYYTPDSKESGVFNRIIPLKDGYRPG
ncbi:MAG: glutamine--tRNA ligase [Oscillospiraceae bacterium]|nr:MAG: glutamine--tRNA ligase [Oscillospiraceae bacterium]